MFTDENKPIDQWGKNDIGVSCSSYQIIRAGNQMWLITQETLSLNPVSTDTDGASWLSAV